MNDEEIKAIEYFKDDISYLEEELKRPNFEGRYITIRSAELEKLKILLNLIEKQKHIIEGKECVIETQVHNEEVLLEQLEKKDKQIEQYINMLATNDMLHVLECEKKNKIIDLMASYIWKYDCCGYEIGKEGKCKSFYLEKDCKKQCIKEYFENKVKESK